MDDIVEKSLHYFTFLLYVLAEEEEAVGLFLRLVDKVEALFIFIYIIEFVLEVSCVRLEVHQHDFRFSLAAGHHLHGFCLDVVAAKLVSRGKIELVFRDPLRRKGGFWVYERGSVGLQVDLLSNLIIFHFYYYKERPIREKAQIVKINEGG